MYLERLLHGGFHVILHHRPAVQHVNGEGAARYRVARHVSEEVAELLGVHGRRRHYQFQVLKCKICIQNACF